MLSLRVHKSLVAKQNPRTNKFPLMISNLRALRSLSIKSDETIVDELSAWPSLISSLPPTLQSLCIDFKGAHYSILNHAPDSALYAFHAIQRDTPHGRTHFLPLEEYFPTLHTLEIGGQGLQPGTSDFQDLQTLAGLPPTLTRLVTSLTLSLKLFTVYFQQLPPLIRHIEGIKHWGSARTLDLGKWSADLLPNLEVLTMAYRLPSEDYFWLPRSLTECEKPEVWNLATARSWPPAVTSLTLPWMDENSFTSAGTTWYLELPPRLTDLTFIDYFRLTPNDLAVLPRTLVKVSLARIDFGSSDDAVPTSVIPFPSTLKRASLRGYYKASRASFLLRSLPTTLEYLFMLVSQALNADELPPSLTYLDLGLKQLPQDALIGSFPSRISTFDLDWDRAPTAFSFPDSIKSLHLYIPDIAPASIGSWKLPARLELLKTDNWPCEGLALIPKSVTSLRIERLIGTTIQDVLATGGMFELLPPNLVHLGIIRAFSGYNDAHRVKLTDVPPQRMAHLRHLTHLSLDFFGLLESGWVRELPRGLESVTVKLKPLAAEDAPFLPQGLTQMYLGKYVDYTTEEIAANWPMWVPPPTLGTHRLHAVLKERLAQFHACV